MRRTNALEASEMKKQQTTSHGPLTESGAAEGPLTVSTTNSRYFVVASGESAEQKAVYLTGSHVNNIFYDGSGPGPDCAEVSERNDFPAYLAFLKAHGHNFIRLWRWEHFKSQSGGGGFHLCMSPQPWPRSGTGVARDGKPRFDLAKFDPAFFDRLRAYVIAAGNAGVYVDVMLFEGWALHLSPVPDQIEGHPFFAANNVNDIGIRSITDTQRLPLDPRIQAIQEAYIHKVIDSVHDLPNVLFEVSNESAGGGTIDANFARMLGMDNVPDWGDSTHWQYWVIDVVKSYERQKGYVSHPIGMTMQYPVTDQTQVNVPLFNSKAEWISPGYDDSIFKNGPPPMAPGSPPSRWFVDPPANDGAKVILSDTDHYSPMTADAQWAWKSFLRGHNPILYDLGIISGVNPPDPTISVGGAPPYASLEPARIALGDTLRYARKMDLMAMTPQQDLSSTGYALANPGQEYLIFQPAHIAESFTLILLPGVYTVEWFNVDRRETVISNNLTIENTDKVHMRAPFNMESPVVLYLRNTTDK
jgi:hypothetical protein